MRVRYLDRPAVFSERAGKAFQLANQEAQRLNHAAVGCEHLLLGLVKEAISPAAELLRRAGFGLPWLRRQVERLHPPGPAVGWLPGALPYTAELDEFIDAVIRAGECNGVLPLTPELLLIALVEQPEAVVSRILRQRRLSMWWLRRRLRRLA
jgi:ATP-dependent Clp protease ATP-binding subunit ClpC